LSRIVTGDETWVHHYEPESKSQSGNTRDRQRRRNSWLTQSSAGEVMPTVFWDSKGHIPEDYLQKGCTALCSSLVHTASGAVMFTLAHQQGNWRDQGVTSITWPQ
jgi:hypothetical protein